MEIEDESEDEGGKGEGPSFEDEGGEREMSYCEYFEFEDSKSSLLLTATEDPIIEINSDSEEEPSASSNPGQSSLSAAELNRLNKRQETAILELDIAAAEQVES